MLKGILIVILLLLSSGIVAQRITVLGKVLDAFTKETLPGANIIGTTEGTTSDSLGRFSLSSMKGDTLMITFVGYETAFQVASLEEMTITLITASKKLTELVVRADRIIAEEFTSRKLSRLDIYKNSSAKADPILAVNSMPYATTTDESANISLRGGSPAETGIFLNDVPINDAIRYSQLNGLGTFSIFNTAIINRVLVYPGNPPLEYGNSTSGVIALSTNEEIPARRVATVSLTLAGAGVYTSFQIDSTSSMTMFTNVQHSGGFVTLNRKATVNLKSFSSADLGVHYFKKFQKDFSAKFFNYSLWEKYKSHQMHPTYDGLFLQSKARNFTVLNFVKKIGKFNFSLNQGLSLSTADYQYSIMDINMKLNDYFGSFNVHRFSQSSEWKTGIMYSYQSANSQGQFPAYYYAYGEQHPVRSIASLASLQTAEYFGYYKKSIGHWIVGGGLRKNLPRHNDPGYLSHQVNLRYAVRCWKFIASLGNYNKYRLRENDSAKELLQSRQYSLDVQYDTKKLESSMSVFHKRSLKRNTRTSVNGIEVFVRYRLKSNLTSQLSITSLDAFDQVGERKVPSPYDIHYFIRGNVEYKIRGTWFFTLVYLFRHGSHFFPVVGSTYHSELAAFEPSYDMTPQRLPPYNTIDLSVTKLFVAGKNLTTTAFVSVSNVMDFKNTRGYVYNFDYTSLTSQWFSRRLLYFGCVINF